MNDPEIEDLLRRYRPAGPPPRLRARVMPPRAWPWAAAAAALLAVTVSAHSATDRLRGDADLRAAPDASTLAAEALAEQLGGDAAARRSAELIIAEQELRTEGAAANGQQNTDSLGEMQ